MSEDSDLLEIYKQHGAAHEKYTYFLLAAAGAAIGFAVQKTEGVSLTWWLLACGVAVVCWGLSFYCGCKGIGLVKSAMHANYGLLQLRRGIHPSQPSHPQELQIAMSSVGATLDRLISEGAGYYNWQFRFLVTGAIFFLVWHVQTLVAASGT
jgi:hypothetical protein